MISAVGSAAGAGIGPTRRFPSNGFLNDFIDKLISKLDGL
jgi:hypothetical protein